MANLRLVPKKRYSAMRKIALGTWRPPREACAYGSMTLRMESTLEYISEFRRKTRKPLTLLQLMIKALGTALAEIPEANAVIRFGRIYQRKDVAVFCQVFLKDRDTG